MSDAFLSERDAHFVRDVTFGSDARLRRVSRTHRITYHSEAASLITKSPVAIIIVKKKNQKSLDKRKSVCYNIQAEKRKEYGVIAKR